MILQQRANFCSIPSEEAVLEELCSQDRWDIIRVYHGMEKMDKYKRLGWNQQKQNWISSNKCGLSTREETASGMRSGLALPNNLAFPEGSAPMVVLHLTNWQTNWHAIVEKTKNYQAESNPTAILIFRKCKNVIYKNHPNLIWTAFSSSATLILERGSYLTLSYLITGRLPDPMGWEPMQSILNGFKIQGESSSRQWLPNVVRWGKWVLEIKRFQFFLSRQEPSIEWGRWGKKNVTKTLTTKSLS